jgi:hypothetical protein
MQKQLSIAVWLTPKVKILSDEVKEGRTRWRSALFQTVQWVVAPTKRRMFAIGNWKLVFGGNWEASSKSHIAIGLPRPSLLVGGRDVASV